MIASTGTWRNWSRCWLFALPVIIVGSLNPGATWAGIVIAAGDEWPTSNQAYTQNLGPTTAYVTNVDNFIGGSNYLIYQQATNLAAPGTAYGSSFIATMTSLGNTVTVIPGATPFTSSLIAPYDAVFIAGNTNGAGGASGLTILNNYVSGGGAVYVALGTGAFGGPATEAGVWNPFLQNWGLTAGTTWFDVTPVVNVPTAPGTHPLRQGVDPITWGFGQQISETNPADPNTDIAIIGMFGPTEGNHSLVGVYALVSDPAVPEPSALLLAGLGAVGLAGYRWRRSASRLSNGSQ